MSGLQLNNATPPPVSNGNGYKASLPSFDALMKSLDLSSTAASSSKGHHHSPHHHHLHPHPHPYPHHSPSPHHMMHRPPSTPPTPVSDDSQNHSNHHIHGREHDHDHRSAKHVYHKGRHAGRPRSSSVPPVSKTHLTSPFRDLHGLSPSPSGDHEHHVSRIQSLKEGDGEWAPYSLNAVAPSSLPYVTLTPPDHLALPPPLARSTTLPSTSINRFDSDGLFPGEPLPIPFSSSDYGNCQRRRRKQSYILPLPFTDDCSEGNGGEQQHLLTPPPSPPLLPVPLPDDESTYSRCYNEYEHECEYPRDKRGDTCTYSTNPNSSSDFEPLPLPPQYLGASHTEVDTGNVRGRKRRYGDTDGLGYGYGHGHEHEYRSGEGVDTNPFAQTSSEIHEAPVPASTRTWHWIESPPQPQLITPPRPHVQAHPKPVKHEAPYHIEHEDTFVAEAILRHLLKVGEKRSWSMI